MKILCTPEQAEVFLKALGSADALFAHHMEVLARPRAYELLAKMINAKFGERQSLNEFRDEALRIAVEHGFKDATVGEDLMLMVSELAEALEDYRKGVDIKTMWYKGYDSTAKVDKDGKLQKPCGIPSEMADVIIRVLHFCGKHGIDIEQAVREKMAYNESRPFMHGKKL